MERLALSVVQPLKSVVDLGLLQEIDRALNQQLKDTMKELRALAAKKDPKHALAMVIWNEGNAASLDSAQNKGAPKRGKPHTTEFAGELSLCFELPAICYEDNFDIDMYLRLLSAHIKKEFTGENYAHRFTFIERSQHWNVEFRKRLRGSGAGDFTFEHLPSKKKLRSKVEVTQFVLYGATRKTRTNIPANVSKDDHTLYLTFKEEDLVEPSKMGETSSLTKDMEVEMEMTANLTGKEENEIKMILDVSWEEYSKKSEEMQVEQTSI